AWHASEMPGLDPNVACHQLTIDPAVSAVVHVGVGNLLRKRRLQKKL
ncbi:hypothetical protein L195_g064277, partial [Trifolium pratense]